MHVRLDGLLDYIFLFSVIITCNTMYSTSQGFAGLGKWATLLLVVSVFLRLLVSRISMKAIHMIMSRSLIFILIILLIVSLNGFKISETSFVYYFVLFPIFMMILQMYYDVNEIANLIRKFVRIIFLLAICSLLFWLIGSVFHIISPTVYVLNYWNGGGIVEGYYNLHFEAQKIEIFGAILVRNTGIFAEAPMWSLVLSLALIFQTLHIKKWNFTTWTLIITIMTTTSTTGVYIIGLIFLYVLFSKTSGVKRCVSSLVILAIIYCFSILWDNKSGTGSATIRFDDYKAGFLAWQESPIWGLGISDGLRAIEQHMDRTVRYNLGYSNSFFVVLAQGGIMLISYYFYPVIKIILNKFSSNDLKFSALLIIFLMLTTIFTETYMFLFVISLYYSIAFGDDRDCQEKQYITN